MKSKLKNILIFSIIGVLILASIVCVCCVLFIKPSSNKVTISCIESITLNVGESKNLDIKCSDNNAKIEIVSANSKIAKVENNIVYAIKEGNTSLRITASSDKAIGSKNISVKVIDPDESFEVDLDKEINLYSLSKDHEAAYNDGVFDYVDFSCEYDFYYIIESSEIIEIENNRIKAKSIGSTKVTFYSKNNPNLKSSHTINVRHIVPTLNLKSSRILSLKAGEFANVIYSVGPSYYTGEANVTTSFTNDKIARLDYNKITALKEGQTTLNIYLNDNLVESINITVLPADPDTPDIPELPPEDNEDEKEEYTIVITPESNVIFQESTLYFTSKDAVIRISVVDKNNSTIETAQPVITGISFNKIISGRYLLSFETESTICISFEDLGVSKEINIKRLQN